MQHFRNLKNPKNLPIDLTGVRQMELDQAYPQSHIVPVQRPPHDGKSYREKHGAPGSKADKKK